MTQTNVSLKDLEGLAGNYQFAASAGKGIVSGDDKSRNNIRNGINGLVQVGDPNHGYTNEQWDEKIALARKLTEQALAKYTTTNRDALIELIPAGNLEKKLFGIAPLAKLDDAAPENEKKAHAAHKIAYGLQKLHDAFQDKEIDASTYRAAIAQATRTAHMERLTAIGYDKDIVEAYARLSYKLAYSHEGHAQAELGKVVSWLGEDIKGYLGEGVVDYARKTLKQRDVSDRAKAAQLGMDIATVAK